MTTSCTRCSGTGAPGSFSEAAFLGECVDCGGRGQTVVMSPERIDHLPLVLVVILVASGDLTPEAAQALAAALNPKATS